MVQAGLVLRPLDPSAQLSRCHAPRRDQGGQRVRPPGARRGRDHLVAGHGQHVADVLLLQPGAQLRVAAVDLIPGHPGERDPRRGGALDHLPRQSGLGREPPVLRDARASTPLRVGAGCPLMAAWSGQACMPPAAAHDVHADRAPGPRRQVSGTVPGMGSSLCGRTRP